MKDRGRWILAGLVVGLILCLVAGVPLGFVVGRWSAPRHNTATAATNTPAAPNTEPVEAASANYCPEGLYPIEGWSSGICGDANLIAAAEGLPKGEVQGPVKGKLIILSEYHDEHCYDDPTFWPLTEGVVGSLPVPFDKVVPINLPDGRWGLGGASECEVKVLVPKPLIADYCPEGLHPIPDWSIGICGDENIIAATARLPYGEVRSNQRIRGKLLILSAYQDEHCYGNKAAFWSHVEGVTGSYPVPLDEIVLVDLPAGHWGLGGATACKVCEKVAEVPAVVPEPTPVVVPTAEPVDPCEACGLRQIPEWSNGICGDEVLIAATTGIHGEIQGPVKGRLRILGNYQGEHCYGDEATFWPLTEGVVGSYPVPLDKVVEINLPTGLWGLGGAVACQ